MRNVLKLAIATTIVLWAAGCTSNVQMFGRGNTIESSQRTKRDSDYHARKVRGEVSVQETLERARK